MQHEIQIYVTADGRIPYEEYLDALRDRQAKLLIARRIQRAALGNFGDRPAWMAGCMKCVLITGRDTACTACIMVRH